MGQGAPLYHPTTPTYGTIVISFSAVEFENLYLGSPASQRCAAPKSRLMFCLKPGARSQWPILAQWLSELFVSTPPSVSSCASQRPFALLAWHHLLPSSVDEERSLSSVLARAQSPIAIDVSIFG